MNQDIILTVDYHDRQCVIREFDHSTGAERLHKVPTEPSALERLVKEASSRAVPRGGRVIWIQESTTGWARVQTLLKEQVEFRLANVLQMPLPPKARRRKTDKVDTARMQREYLAGTLPYAHQPTDWWRQVRRLVAMRETLVARRTAVTNWINRYMAHETWEERAGLFTSKGRERLLKGRPETDLFILELRLEQWELLGGQLRSVERKLRTIYDAWPDAQRIDLIRGIDVVSAVSLLARIGPIERFRNADQLIAYAGLAPGIRQSDKTCHAGRIGGGGTDRHLRHYLIEASLWARQLPRFAAGHERLAQRRGKRIARISVARRLVRSLYKVLRDQVAFHPGTVEVAMV